MAVWHKILLPKTLALEGSEKIFAYYGSCRSRKEQLAFAFMDCVSWKKNIFFAHRHFPWQEKYGVTIWSSFSSQMVIAKKMSFYILTEHMT